MPAEVQSRTGLKPVRRGTAPFAECESVATEPGRRLKRDQCRREHKIHCSVGPGKKYLPDDRACSYPEQR